MCEALGTGQQGRASRLRASKHRRSAERVRRGAMVSERSASNAPARPRRLADAIRVPGRGAGRRRARERSRERTGARKRAPALAHGRAEARFSPISPPDEKTSSADLTILRNFRRFWSRTRSVPLVRAHPPTAARSDRAPPGAPPCAEEKTTPHEATKDTEVHKERGPGCKKAQEVARRISPPRMRSARRKRVFHHEVTKESCVLGLGSVNCSPAQLLHSLGASPTLTLTEQAGVIHWHSMSKRKRRQPAPRSKTPPSGSACPEPSRRASEGKGGGGFSPALLSPAQLPGASPRGGGSSSVPRASRPSSLLDTRVIYCGDCLEQLRSLPHGCVDLIYIDPPFNSNRNYEVFWGETKEARAFEDRHANTPAYIDYVRPTNDEGSRSTSALR